MAISESVVFCFICEFIIQSIHIQDYDDSAILLSFPGISVHMIIRWTNNEYGYISSGKEIGKATAAEILLVKCVFLDVSFFIACQKDKKD